MLDELLDAVAGDASDNHEDSDCCRRGHTRPGGIRGLMSRLFGGDDDADDERRDGPCCDGRSAERDAAASRPALRDQPDFETND